ncbi:MAG: 30S ribosomal protein S3 [Gammaproteobacteria bacterium RIFCSPHIGHO2_02_FULL_39_13]|nr:MAG: 30S ribosomal protein S3 [Gammaproteobacteria bacterium RIFCSPHIGHO2_02_FULL_39_13]OGT48621.1 MAG: 30S ribosomal protein S3 [Gammaproteobacteria bacterium RIFCSPHIGHO2_12_FULL_39_24]
MGQKVNPTGIRLGITETWKSMWFAHSEYADYLNADLKVREYLMKKLAGASISRIQIDRPARNAKIAIHSARPGVIIGKKGSDVDTLRKEVSKIMNVPVHITIEEIRKPEIDAKLVAESVAQQLERRIMFRRAMKKAMQSAIRHGALGVKVCMSGRLGGAEIARVEWAREGRVPLHTFRANIDYATAIAKTTYGIIGVKVWIYKGEILDAESESAEAVAVVESTEK